MIIQVIIQKSLFLHGSPYSEALFSREGREQMRYSIMSTFL